MKQGDKVFWIDPVSGKHKTGILVKKEMLIIEEGEDVESKAWYEWTVKGDDNNLYSFSENKLGKIL